MIVPVGALEAHGPHLPLGADQIQAEATADALAERIDALVAPTITYGACPSARNFPGTVSVPMADLERYARGVFSELGRMGVRRLLVLSGHAERGHMAALREAADAAMQATPGLRAVVLSDYDFVYELRGELAPSTDGHAGLLETSRVLAMAPELGGTGPTPRRAHRGRRSSPVRRRSRSGPRASWATPAGPPPSSASGSRPTSSTGSRRRCAPLLPA